MVVYYLFFANYLSDLIRSSWFLLHNVVKNLHKGRYRLSHSCCSPGLTLLMFFSRVCRNFFKSLYFWWGLVQLNLSNIMHEPLYAAHAAKLQQVKACWKPTCQVRAKQCFTALVYSVQFQQREDSGPVTANESGLQPQSTHYILAKLSFISSYSFLK